MADTEWRTTLSRFGLAVVGVAVFGLFAGWFFGRTSPERAAGLLVDDFVETEEVGAPPADPAAPTSGESSADASCDIHSEPVAADVQVATLEAGGVVLQYRPTELGDGGLALLREVALSGVLLAPNPDLATPVAGTAWGRRLSLDAPNRELIAAFVAAYADPGACPG